MDKNPRRRNSIIITVIPVLVVLAGLVLYQHGFLGVRASMSEMKEVEAVKTKTLTKYIDMISSNGQLEEELVRLKEARKADASKVVEGQTLSMSAATLQNTVKGIVTGRNGTISSERVEKPEDVGSFKVISISIESTIPDAKALSDILYAIETRTPYLVMREVDVRVRNFTEPKELMVKFKISALTVGK
jgi:hypothetical protein